MSEHREPRRRAVSTRAITNHPYSAGALGDHVPKRHPFLASPVPSLRPYHQQRPSTTSSSNLSDPPSTRGMMKRLLAKPAPPSSPTAPFPSPSMSPGFHHANDHESQDQDPPPTDALPIPNEFDKSIRALDLVGQIDISMTPCTTAALESCLEPPEFAKKQRNVFRRRPSGTAVTIPPVPTLPSFEYPFGFRSVDDLTSATATQLATPTSSITTSTTPPSPRHSPSPPTRHPTPKKSSACSVPGRPKAAHSHPTNPNAVDQSNYTILGDNPTTVGAGGSGDLFWDTCGEYKKGEQLSEDGGESTRILSGKWRKNDSDQIRSKPSVHEFARSSVDKDHGTIKKSPNVPAGGSPSKRFWNLVKKISVSGLREKNKADSDHLPPVPPLPSHLTNDPFCTPINSSLSALALSPTTHVAVVPSTPPSPSAQHRTKHSHSAPHFPPSQLTTGPRPSTTTRSSSPYSDVASSQFFNRQSARSSTSSLGEEAIQLPPLPETSISDATSKTNGKTNANDTNANLIISPRDLSQNDSISNFSPIAISYQPPPNMDDDWTIVRSPSAELEALSLPPPPRQLFKSIGIGVGHKAAGFQGNKEKAKVNISSEHVDEKNRDVSNNAHSQKNEENIEEIKQEDKEKDVSEPNTDRDSNRSQSPTIPSFSTSSAINSFPARRVSSSLSARSKGSPIAFSPDRSDRSSGSVFSTANGPRSPSRSPQRHGSHTTFGRVRQHLFGNNDVRVKAEEDEEIDEVLNPLLSVQKSDAHLGQLYSSSHPPQQQDQTKAREYNGYSSRKTSITPKPRSTHTAASSVSMPTSPTITYHRRSVSFNTSSPALPTRVLFTSPNPFSDASRLSSADAAPPITPLPPPPVSPSLTSSMGHRTRSYSNLRTAFPSRKLSEVLFPSSSASLPARASPSSSSGHRTIGSPIGQSISIGASNHSKSNTPNPVISSQPLTQLTDQEKADKWNDLLARSARAGGTLHLAAGSLLLGSDEI